MKKVLLLLALSSTCFASGQKYNFDDPKLNDEFTNVYKSIDTLLKATPVRISTETVSTSTITNGEINNLKQLPLGGTPCAGCIGETISATASNVTPAATGNYSDLTSITLSPGIWDISGVAETQRNGATWTVTLLGISSTAGNSLVANVGDSYIDNSFASSSTTPNEVFMVIPCVHVSITGSTVYYLKNRDDYSAGTPNVNGCRLSAVRKG